jgi:prepilin-type N-terminal cleavage/methylation domain-containing protein
MKRKQKGFTLIELLIVIGIIAILAAAVIITITPGERLKDAREATRASHMAAIGTAIHMTVVENDLYSTVDSVLVDGCSFTTVTPTEFSDACAVVVGLGSAPVDPSEGTGYMVSATTADASGRVEIYSPAASTETEWYSAATAKIF